MGGIICGNRECINKIFEREFMTLGAILAPHDAWLLIRGLRTLPIRMERVAATTRMVVDFMNNHPKIEQVFFPFLPSHPQYELAKKQLKNNTGQFSILLKTDSITKVEAFCDKLKHFLMAASWGGHESLIFPIAAAYTEDNLKPSLPFNLVRFYVGLEDSDYLIKDIEQALEYV